MKNAPYLMNKPADHRSDVMDEVEAAVFLRVCSKTLRKLRQKNKIPFARVSGRILYLRPQLIDWLSAGGSIES